MRKITILLLGLILVGMLIPTGFANDSESIVITYGETTLSNSNYKSIVDNFFTKNAGVDINNVEVESISANDVNEISGSITGKYYNSNQIFSSALVDLTQNDHLEVKVDKSKITTITGDMYISALKSAGITHGIVYVTSPVTSTGESALAGIMDSYEEATDIEIPDSVKEAANNEIFTEAEIVDNSNISADDLSQLVDDVKQEVANDNITDKESIVNIINNHVENNNINITNNDIENLAGTIEQVQNVQGDVNYYKTQINEFLGNDTDSGFSLDSILNWVKSFM